MNNRVAKLRGNGLVAGPVNQVAPISVGDAEQRSPGVRTSQVLRIDTQHRKSPLRQYLAALHAACADVLRIVSGSSSSANTGSQSGPLERLLAYQSANHGLRGVDPGSLVANLVAMQMTEPDDPDAKDLVIRVRHHINLVQRHVKECLSHAKELMTYIVSLAPLSVRSHRLLTARTRDLVRNYNAIARLASSKSMQAISPINEVKSPARITMEGLGMLTVHTSMPSPFPDTKTSLDAVTACNDFSLAVTEFAKIIYELVDTFVNHGLLMSADERLEVFSPKSSLKSEKSDRASPQLAQIPESAQSVIEPSSQPGVEKAIKSAYVSSPNSDEMASHLSQQTLEILEELENIMSSKAQERRIAKGGTQTQNALRRYPSTPQGNSSIVSSQKTAPQQAAVHHARSYTVMGTTSNTNTMANYYRRPVSPVEELGELAARARELVAQARSASPTRSPPSPSPMSARSAGAESTASSATFQTLHRGMLTAPALDRAPARWQHPDHGERDSWHEHQLMLHVDEGGVGSTSDASASAQMAAVARPDPGLSATSAARRSTIYRSDDCLAFPHPPPPAIVTPRVRAVSASSPFPPAISHPTGTAAHPPKPLPARNPYAEISIFESSRRIYKHRFTTTRVDLTSRTEAECGVCQRGFKFVEKRVVCKDCRLTLHRECYRDGHPEHFECGQYNSPDDDEMLFDSAMGPTPMPYRAPTSPHSRSRTHGV